MPPIRVVLAALPQMLLEIISDVVEEQPDMTLTGSFATCDELVRASPALDTDVVVMGLSGEQLTPGCDELLFSFRGARCLAITDDGRNTFLYELRPHREEAGALSLDDLLSLIRGRRPTTPTQSHRP